MATNRKLEAKVLSTVPSPVPMDELSIPDTLMTAGEEPVKFMLLHKVVMLASGITVALSLPKMAI